MGKEIDINELREIQLGILDKIHAFCMERGIRYSLGGGTLLGAVRHKGYIPWDDDVDIMLPRPDYNRFLKEFDGVYPHLKILNAFTDYGYILPFSKVIDERTVLVERVSEEVTRKNGVFVDVFPVDGLPPEEGLDSFLGKMVNINRLMIYTSPGDEALVRFPFLKTICMLFINHRKTVERAEKFISSIDFVTAEYAGAISGRYGHKEHMEANVFREYSDIAFEGRTYRCISAYDAYLTKHYGDYMRLPPIEMQVRNHDFRAWWKAGGGNRQPGVSGMLRVRNDEEFIMRCIESCIPALDELVIVYNDCTDNSPQVIEMARQRYPDKIKVFPYTPHIYAWNLSEDEFNMVMNGQIPAENTLAGYYNYALAHTTKEYVMKIDADQIYFKDKLKELCDAYRCRGNRICRIIDIIRILEGKIYLSLGIRASRTSRLFANPVFWKKYKEAMLDYVRAVKPTASLSGINMSLCDNEKLVSLGKIIENGMNILPPYNGEGDHLIFKVTPETYYIPSYDELYNSLNKYQDSVIERFTGIKTIFPIGVYWYHLNASRKGIIYKTKENISNHPDSFMSIDDFKTIDLFKTLKKRKFPLVPRSRAVIFDFIHQDTAIDDAIH